MTGGACSARGARLDDRVESVAAAALEFFVGFSFDCLRAAEAALVSGVHHARGQHDQLASSDRRITGEVP